MILIGLFGQIYHSIIDLTGIVFYLSMACRVVCSVDMSILISSWVIGLVSRSRYSSSFWMSSFLWPILKNFTSTQSR